MAVHGEPEIARGLRNSIESFGVGLKSGKQKKYLFGALPMADAFIAWSNAPYVLPKPMLPDWQKSFLLGSVFVFLVIFGVLYMLWGRLPFAVYS